MFAKQDHLGAWNYVAQHLGDLDLQHVRQGDHSARSELLCNSCLDRWMSISKHSRAPGHDIINPLVALRVTHAAALRLFDEHGITATGPAAGNPLARLPHAPV